MTPDAPATAPRTHEQDCPDCGVLITVEPTYAALQLAVWLHVALECPGRRRDHRSPCGGPIGGFNEDKGLPARPRGPTP